jgi:UDP-N-acetylmuramoylalanine--D-glutamate ligase
MAGYAAAKREIFARQDADCTAVIGIDDAESCEMAEWLHTGPARVVEISGEDIQDLRVKSLPGKHNAQNASAATAMARALGVDWGAIVRGIASFPGLPHRQQEVALRGGVQFINDSKATNADAASRAMGCYERFVWIAGGVAKAGGIDELAPFFPRIEKAFLIGQDGAVFARRLSEAGVANENVETLERAVPAAFAAAAACGVVLFSPAAASFDQFANFEVRGKCFAALAEGGLG